MALLLSLTALQGANITLQQCLPSAVFPSGGFRLQSSSSPSASLLQSLADTSSCIAAAASSGSFLSLSVCNASDATQQWTFRADGTVQSAADTGE